MGDEAGDPILVVIVEVDMFLFMLFFFVRSCFLVLVSLTSKLLLLVSI